MIEDRDGSDFQQRVLDFIDFCQSSVDEASIVAEYHQLAAKAGFPAVSVVNLWEAGGTILSGVRSTTLAPGLVENYSSQRLHLRDPVWKTAEQCRRPFRFQQAFDAANDHSSDEIRAIYRENGIFDGFVIPVAADHGRKSLVFLNAVDPIALSPDEETLLSLATIIFRRSPGVQFSGASEASLRRHRLTVREREVLTWTAAGKSAWEISEILGLSEATVSRHLLNVKVKLKAANTVQAVAEAIRNREISV